MPNTPPVCLIDQPAPAGNPSVTAIPAIPNATTDAVSMLAAIRALTQAVNILQQQIPTVQWAGAKFANDSGSGKSPQKPNPNNNANFAELIARRTTTVTRVYNPNDASQYVDVKQITGLTFYNKTSGEYIQWNQGGNSQAG